MKNSRIVAITKKEDPHLREVSKYLSEEPAVVDLSEFSTEAGLNYHISSALEVVTTISIGRELFDLNQYSRVWFRRVFDVNKFKKQHPLKEYSRQEVSHLIESIGATLSPDHIFPRYDSMIRARNKVRQLVVAKTAGFNIPKTVVGSSAFDTKELLDAEYVAIKPLLSSTIALGENDQIISLPTIKMRSEELMDENNISRLSKTPSIIQNYIEKKYEVRITVVEDKIFAMGVDTQSDPGSTVDSRLGDTMKMNCWVEDLPASVKNKILLYMKKTGTNFACIDMIVNEDGDYIFLEANPNGQWLWVEEKTGLEIASAIANALEN